jgi:hypothetical protein
VTAEDLKEAFLSKGIYVRYARILAFPRSDGRFVSRGYGWVSIDDGKGSERKAMEQVQAIDKFIVRDVSSRSLDLCLLVYSKKMIADSVIFIWELLQRVLKIEVCCPSSLVHSHD